MKGPWHYLSAFIAGFVPVVSPMLLSGKWPVAPVIVGAILIGAMTMGGYHLLPTKADSQP